MTAKGKTRRAVAAVGIDPVEVEAELLSRSFRDYANAAWRIIEPSTPLVGGFYVDAICDHLEATGPGRPIRRLIINVPPRSLKSTLASVLFPTWVWTHRPQVRFLYSSYNDGLATRDAVRSRRVIESGWYDAHWGRVFKMTGDQNVKTRYENNRTGYRLVTSVGGSATGEGGDYIIVDDPHNVREVESDTVRQGVLVWWDEVMMSRRNDLRESSVIVVMQRTHLNDLTGHLLSKNAGYEHLCLPLEYSPSRVIPPTKIGWRDPRSAEGEMLCEDRVRREDIPQLILDVGGRYAYSAQYNQEPSQRSGGIVKRSQFRFWKVLPSKFAWFLQSWDCSFKDLKTSSFVVGQAWGLADGCFYLVDEVRAQMTFSDTKVAVVAFHAKFPRVNEVIVEDKANGTAILDELRRAIPGLLPGEPEGSKEARFIAVSPYYEAGNVYVPDPNGASWVNDHIEELCNFPTWRWNDRVDAASQAIRRLAKRLGGIGLFVGRSASVRGNGNDGESSKEVTA